MFASGNGAAQRDLLGFNLQADDIRIMSGYGADTGRISTRLLGKQPCSDETF